MGSSAIVGAGAAGLSALRAMRRQGHDARAFEVADSLGGTWRYDGDEATASKSKAPTPMYASLRTNLPREVMGFREFPFDATGEELFFEPAPTEAAADGDGTVTRARV